MKKTLKRQTNIIKSGVVLGAGVAILGNMGTTGQTIAGKIGNPGANMLGVASTVNMGMGVMNMVNKNTKKYSKRRR